jgi:outer membrane protein assembly factor BamB
MKRRDFIGMVAGTGASLAAAPAAFAQEPKLTGRVTAAGKAMASVAVSNGAEVTLTGDDGTFELPRRGADKFVFVTAPSGWTCEKWYLPISEKKDGYDFGLAPWAASATGRELSFVHISDSEISSVNAREQAWAKRVKDIADETDAAFIVHTGDICGAAGLKAHIRLMNSANMGRPMEYVIGNHDIIKGKYEYGEELFESLYGPLWRSFDACGVHLCCIPMGYGDVKPRYSASDVAKWLKADLALVPKGRPVVILCHSLQDGSLFDTAGLNEGVLKLGRKGDEVFDVTAACNLTGFVFGHQHNNLVRRFGKIAAIQTAVPQKGGVDLSPAAARVIRVDASGRLSSEIRYYPSDRWKTVSAAPAGGWIAKAPSSVYLGSPSTDGKRIFVGTLDDDGAGTGAVVAFDAHCGKTLWTAPMPNSVYNRTVVCNGKVIAQDAQGGVHALDCATGREVWTYAPPHVRVAVYEQGIAVDRERSVVFAHCDYGLVALDALSGRKIWQSGQKNLYGATSSCITFAEGVVTSEQQWHGIYAADARTGRQLWARRRDGLNWRSGSPAAAAGRMFLTSGDKLVELDLFTGETIRERKSKCNMQIPTTPLVSATRIFAGTAKEGLVAFDRESLEEIWRGDVGDALTVTGSYVYAPSKTVGTAPFFIGASTVAAAASDGCIHFWDAATGAKKHCIATGAPYFNAPLVFGDMIYAADFAGMVRAIPIPAQVS